jgi:N-acetylglutamate synthase-like GNAT family acetyltransferase
MKETDITYREDVLERDADAVRHIVESTEYFNREEADIAVELVTERLAKGLSSGYRFVFAELDGKAVGYSCYGHISGTSASYDLYWIVVTNTERGKHLGSTLLAVTEEKIAKLGGKRIYVETSSKDQYKSTRGFYLKNKYIEDAVIKDFYDTNDSKVIYVKVLP